MRSVMLTGATGFIGSHIAERLIRESLHVSLFVRRENELIHRLKRDGAKVYVGLYNDPSILKKALRNVDTVIHCAGATKALNARAFREANVSFTESILQLMGKNQRFVFISSQASAGPSDPKRPVDETAEPRPVSIYGKTKLMAERSVMRWGEECGKNYVILRPGIVYGPREKDLFKFFKIVGMGFFPILGNGCKKVSLVHVDDLVCAVIKAAAFSPPAQTYFVSNDHGSTLEEIGRAIAGALGRTSFFKIRLPEWMGYPAALLSEVLALITGKPTLTGMQKLLELKQPAWLCSNQKITRTLGWKPEIPLDEGMKQTADWYIKENWI